MSHRAYNNQYTLVNFHLKKLIQQQIQSTKTPPDFDSIRKYQKIFMSKVDLK